MTNGILLAETPDYYQRKLVPEPPDGDFWNLVVSKTDCCSAQETNAVDFQHGDGYPKLIIHPA